jgi:hypothetical protein
MRNPPPLLLDLHRLRSLPSHGGKKCEDSQFIEIVRRFVASEAPQTATIE